MSFFLYRVQHRKDGRGPFRPGFSAKWSDPWPHPHPDCVSWIEEFGLGIISGIKADENAACGCRTAEQIHKWFSKTEMERLFLLGYRVYLVDYDRVLAESENQVVFCRRKPLHVGVVEIECSRE